MTIKKRIDWKRSITNALRMAYALTKSLPWKGISWVFLALIIIWEFVSHFF